MWTSTSFYIDPVDALEVERSDLMGYYHPREIVADTSLSVARRRALIAHWLSDRNAVRGVPGLRSTSTGVTASVDELKAALSALDDAEATIPAQIAAQQMAQAAGAAA
jgi:hypothetical protein